MATKQLMMTMMMTAMMVAMECGSDGADVYVNGGFTQWSEYSACSTTCGRGVQTRTRTCTNPPPSGGGKGCGRVTQQNKKCNLKPCKGTEIINFNSVQIRTPFFILYHLVNGGFTQWSEYSECSVTCGKGVQTRTRTCTNPPPSGGGKNYGKITQQTKKCNLGK
ncbi:ectin-like [Orbicella faveolata]|uniref:ectin-like n=1 Tax=Orbicella faveolata TaxID=48498 RepID=UPI0009E2DF0B|nr:ectin-like [Orbicella faveolata]